jgi:hypothetical protein
MTTFSFSAPQLKREPVRRPRWGYRVWHRSAPPQHDRRTTRQSDLARGVSYRAIGSPQRRRAMWDVRRTAVRVEGLGGAIAVGGSPDLRAVRREAAAWASERPARCRRHYGSGGPGTRGGSHLGSVRAWVPPMDPRNCYRCHVSYLVRWGRCVDEESESACRTPARLASASLVACVERFKAGADGRWYCRDA